MNKLNKPIFNKVLMSLFTLLVLSNCTLAINLEYKNSLSKVELSRVSDDSYNINLYTSKKYTDPVKIIKKNDLNYYILLPETKNSSGIISSAYSDIRSVSTDSYPYAGQDVNNGYTKINITTTKPVNFNVNVKNSASNSVSYAAKAAKLTQAPVPNENQVQKKNSENIPQAKKDLTSSKTNAATKPAVKLEKTVKKETVAQKQPVNVNKTRLQSKVEAKPEQKSEAKPSKQEKQKVKPVLEKAIINNSLQNNQPKEQVNEQPSEIIQEESKEQKPQVSEEIINDFESVLKSENQQEDTSYNTEIEQNGFQKYLPVIKSKFKAVINKVNDIADNLGVSLGNLAFMLFSGIFAFFAVLFILTRKQKPAPKIKNRIDLLDGKATIKSKTKNNDDDKYFILDKNIKQVVFSDPASSAINRNYELSTYDPELKNYERLKASKLSKEKQDSEYDIIQKILREDSLIDISSGEYDVIDSSKVSYQPDKGREILTKQLEKEKTEAAIETETKANTKQTEIVTSPIAKEEMKITLQDEPTVLSKVEIAPEKGFMCVSYNENISLVGYIFDDVFALYNFKCSKLENYDIRYRLTDKDEYGVNFIVKVDKAKILVRVAKSSMKLQVVL